MIVYALSILIMFICAILCCINDSIVKQFRKNESYNDEDPSVDEQDIDIVVENMNKN